MRALSIRQPWVWAILHAGKLIENRHWHCHYRGPVWLHASKWWNEREVRECLQEDVYPTATVTGVTLSMSIDEALREVRAQLGGIVGRARIVGCIQGSRSPWFMGAHGFVLADVVALPRLIPCRGALGLFDVPSDVEQAALAALSQGATP